MTWDPNNAAESGVSRASRWLCKLDVSRIFTSTCATSSIDGGKCGLGQGGRWRMDNLGRSAPFEGRPRAPSHSRPTGAIPRARPTPPSSPSKRYWMWLREGVGCRRRPLRTSPNPRPCRSEVIRRRRKRPPLSTCAARSVSTNAAALPRTSRTSGGPPTRAHRAHAALIVQEIVERPRSVSRSREYSRPPPYVQHRDAGAVLLDAGVAANRSLSATWRA